MCFNTAACYLINGLKLLFVKYGDFILVRVKRLMKLLLKKIQIFVLYPSVQNLASIVMRCKTVSSSSS